MDPIYTAFWLKWLTLAFFGMWAAIVASGVTLFLLLRLFLAVVLLLITGAAYAGSPPQCLLRHELAHAGGWPANHANAIYTKECGGLPMPPRAFPIRGKKPVIKYVPSSLMIWYCGPRAQACSSIGGDPAWIVLPRGVT